ncbi:aminotransferase class I/II-fold pyridoxal phosphate-dependent enzyme [Blautia sp. MSJ-19]|uniref:aminotransferase class I/II-fold pyridoxal phosphate-dependent enzyme n=1 Tax=Blautia sp. MSJ-19 TaxID=2841517 RepID=UPI001C0EF42A|nr:aminotransferase class I/II-fold pyridoxal phosphate-dependent enzyme [Blautia sp. MSJ-19]MBU5482153.1 aminotransferase class I/II-fold pyridoxal phosphate-dependent enzyme [Blautia sp. MSJ-19]
MERLYRKLEEYSRSDYYPFHMPGHKRNPESVRGEFPFERDITEIEGFDNLHHPEDILLEAQQNVAKVYGVRESFYSVNGSTAALLAAISAAVPRNGEILVARNCHKAVYHGIYLRNLKPTYIYPQMDNEWWINGGIFPDKVERCLAANPEIKAVLLTSPTYDGVVSDIREIAEIVHRYEIPLIIDEAHGAHFHFSNYFPTSAAELGADLVIQSFHKTLPAMTQTAVLHNCSERVDSRLIRRFMGIYQTSSPSYILMASMDACMDTMNTEGHQMFRNFTMMLEQTRKRLSKCKYIRLVEPQIGENGVFDYDRSKLIFSTRYSSLSGTGLYHVLLERYHIQMEMESENYVLAIAAVGDSEEGFERLCQAIEELNQEQITLTKDREEKGEELLDARSMHCVLTQMMSMADAMETESESCPLEESVGRISAEFAYLYPPGIPLLTPGEQITGQFIRNMRIYMEKGLYLQGLDDYSNKSIRVVVPQAAKEQFEETDG